MTLDDLGKAPRWFLILAMGLLISGFMSTLGMLAWAGGRWVAMVESRLDRLEQRPCNAE